MDLFENNKVVRLKSHLDKYLVADDDQQTTRQSRNGQARRACWIVEHLHGSSSNDFIRLKTFSGYYLTASNDHFLLGMTGKKVIQSKPQNTKDLNTLWKPIRDGFQVKLMAYDGSFLRANGGSPPWRNSITHDVPQAISSTNNWILWEVEAVEEEVPENEGFNEYLSRVSGGLSSVSDELEELGSPSPRPSINKSPQLLKNTAMEIFLNAKAVRLKSVVHNKYLTADEDQESVTQSRNASAKSARWVVELVENTENIIRLKSCYNKYLTASNQPFLLGMTGRKVIQSIPYRLDSSVEWEPVKEAGNNHIKLKTRYGQLLRANGGLPPWRNSITHDIPHRTATQDWVVWDVHVLEINGDRSQSPAAVLPLLPPHSDSFTSDSSSPSSRRSSKSASFSGQEFGDSLGDPSPTPKVGDGRTIYYRIADEYGEVEEGLKGGSITFKGNGVEELTKKLQVETGLDDIVVCSRSPLNGKLYPLRLQLPPNNATMNVVLFQSSPSSGKGNAGNITTSKHLASESVWLAQRNIQLQNLDL